MQPVDWMLRLQQQNTPENTRILVRAFIHEPLIIRAMQQEGFFERTLERADGWMVADLALTAMGCPLKAADLKKPEMLGIDTGLRSSALQAYEIAYKRLTPPANLAEAGLLAIALRERRRLTNGWHGLLSELTQGTLKDQPGLAYEIWKTPLACLYQMVPDGMELCQTLLSRQTLQPGSRWISHIMLANPLEEAERVKIFTTLMRKISPEMSAAWLRELRLSGEVDLATEISLILLASMTPLVEKKRNQSTYIANQPDEALRDTLELQHLAELYRWMKRKNFSNRYNKPQSPGWRGSIYGWLI
jgi:hypothetical protein